MTPLAGCQAGQGQATLPHYITLNLKRKMVKHFDRFTDTIKLFAAKNKLWKWDFSLVLKVCREFDDVTSAGKLFHARATATGNARSPTVDSRIGGISNVEVDDDRRAREGAHFVAFALGRRKPYSYASSNRMDTRDQMIDGFNPS